MKTTSAKDTAVLRPATEDDVEFIAWVMLTAARSHLDRGIWEYLIDGDEETTLRYLAALATTDTVHLFHHSLFLVAEVGGAPAAAMCAYDAATQGFDVYATVLPEVLGRADIAVDFTELLRRGEVLRSGMPEVDVERPWVIENVATRPEFRRRGLVDLLLAALLDRGRKQGFSTGQISVFLGNEPARRAYLKAGFDVTAERRSPSWDAEIGCPGVETLVQPL